MSAVILDKMIAEQERHLTELKKIRDSMKGKKDPCFTCSYNEYDQEGGRICLATTHLARCPVTGQLF